MYFLCLVNIPYEPVILLILGWLGLGWDSSTCSFLQSPLSSSRMYVQEMCLVSCSIDLWVDRSGDMSCKACMVVFCDWRIV